MSVIKQPFRYQKLDDYSCRSYPFYVQIPASKVFHPDVSMWELESFQDGIVEWIDSQMIGDCVYFTTEVPWSRVEPTERFHGWFMFTNEQDMLLFKVFWT